MAEFRLTRRAELQLDEIYTFTEAQFGRYQADAYYAGFERTFGLLAIFCAWGHPQIISKPDIIAFASNHT